MLKSSSPLHGPSVYAMQASSAALGYTLLLLDLLATYLGGPLLHEGSFQVRATAAHQTFFRPVQLFSRRATALCHECSQAALAVVLASDPEMRCDACLVSGLDVGGLATTELLEPAPCVQQLRAAAFCGGLASSQHPAACQQVSACQVSASEVLPWS